MCCEPGDVAIFSPALRSGSVKYLLIEYCCEPNSQLGLSAPAGALVCRCTKASDCCSEPCCEQLETLVKLAQACAVPICCWCSIPCTGGSTWQIVNVARLGVTDKLRGHWALFRRFWRNFERLARLVTSGGGVVALEWPNRCAYWKERAVLKLVKDFSKAIVQGCEYGLKPSHPPAGKEDHLLYKQWRVVSSSPLLASSLERRCTGDHTHLVIENVNTTGSANYPPALAEAIHKAVELCFTPSGTEKKAAPGMCAVGPPGPRHLAKKEHSKVKSSPSGSW